MAKDVYKPRGKLKKSMPGAGVAATIDVPIICTVMSSVDATRQGQLEVYPSENLDKGAFDNTNWITVRRLSGFFGNTKPQGPDDDFGGYVGNPSAYGQWNSPPDKGTKVICIFVNGDPNYGFYIGSAPDPELLSMVPAIGSSENVILNEGEAQSYGGALKLPTTSINSNNKAISDTTNYLTEPKPVHSYTAAIMQQQGVLRDTFRGPISSSASREASSRVGWGVSTPGRPIYDGGLTDEDIASNLDKDPQNYTVTSRRGGHSLVMDDGDIIGRDQLIRLRTALGHQILMSDDGQMLSILHSNGQTYIELGKEGTVDVFATNSVNIRTQGDLNFHADNDLNLHAGRNVNINATENMSMNADKQFTQRVGEDYSLYSLANIKIKADAAIAVASTGQLGLKTEADAFLEGAIIHLNDGAASLTPDIIEPIEIVAHPDTLFDDTKGWAAVLAKLNSITSRAPAHMPWMNANQGVDVTVDSSADAALPQEASAEMSSANALVAGAATVAGVAGATTATIPEVGAISGALDKNTTTTMLGGIATSATSIANGAVSTGTALIKNATGVVTAAVGSFAQTPSQLSAGGVLKPGADTMVNALVAGGASVANAMPNSAFSGNSGTNSLNQLIANPATQAKSVVTNLQKGQSLLTTAGAITGKESSGSISGAVAGTATSLIGQQSGALTSTVSSTLSVLSKATSDPSGLLNAGDGTKAVINSMGQGAVSALTSNLTGGLGGITKALDTISGANIPGIGSVLDAARGAQASSFKAITASFKPMLANVPQNLTELASAAATTVAEASSGMISADLPSLPSLPSSTDIVDIASTKLGI